MPNELSPVVLPADPTTALQAATKQYADTKVPLAGGTLTGALTLSGNPGSALVAAPKQYVDATVRTSLAPVTLTPGATVATDASLGSRFRLSPVQNFTLSNPTNPTDGQMCLWEIIQDATGSRVMTLGTAFALGTDITAVTLTTTASKRDFFGAIYNSTAVKWFIIAFVKGY